MTADSKGRPSAGINKRDAKVGRAVFNHLKKHPSINPEDFASMNGFRLAAVYRVLVIFRSRGWVT